MLRQLGEGLKQTRSKASRFKDHDSGTVGVYDILPTNCLRKAFYGQTLECPEPPEPLMPYIRGKAVENAISRSLLANDAALERHKRFEKAGIVCFTDISGSDRIIEIKDTSVGRRLAPEDIHSGGT